jgi:hypothetical protein
MGRLKPKTEGSAPAPGAVFRALPRRAKAHQRDGGAENPARTEEFHLSGFFRTPNGWIRGRIQQRPGRACSPNLDFQMERNWRFAIDEGRALVQLVRERNS